MIHKSLISATLFLPAVCGQAQSDTLVSELVEKAVASSPRVASRRLQVQEAVSIAEAFGRPQNLQLEAAPGVGFTNSNFLLGQPLDLFGQRAARARRARAEANIARARLRQTEFAVAAEMLAAYAKFLAATENASNAEADMKVAAATLEAIRRRIEIGEAPALQQTRAEIELRRSEQALAIARSDLEEAVATVNSALGRPSDAGIPQAKWIRAGDVVELMEGAVSRVPDVLAAIASIEAAKAAEAEAARRGQPAVFAGLAADIWSTDRYPTERGSVGLQISISMPLADWGENRLARRAAESARKAEEASLKDAERRAALEVQASASRLQAAKQVAESYEQGIVPKAVTMLQAMQSGLESGLSSFLETLEAQRTLAQLRREASDALLQLRLAEVRFFVATAHIPGFEEVKP